jgi:hypothetical protein
MEGIRSKEASHAFLNSGFFLWLSRQRAECQREDQISNRFSLDGQSLAQIFICHKVNEVGPQSVEVEPVAVASAFVRSEAAYISVAPLLNQTGGSSYQPIRSSIQRGD